MKKMSENMPKSELFQEDRKYFKQNDYFCDHKFREDRIKSFRFFQNRKYFLTCTCSKLEWMQVISKFVEFTGTEDDDTHWDNRKGIK